MFLRPHLHTKAPVKCETIAGRSRSVDRRLNGCSRLATPLFLHLPYQSPSFPSLIRLMEEKTLSGITIPVQRVFPQNTSTRKYLCDSPPREIVNISPPVYCIIRFCASAGLAGTTG